MVPAATFAVTFVSVLWVMREDRDDENERGNDSRT